MQRQIFALAIFVATFGALGATHAQNDGSPPPVLSRSLDAAPEAIDAGPAEGPAAEAPDASTGIWELARRSYRAVEKGNWKHFAALMVLVIVFVLRKVKGIRKWVKDRVGDDRGGVIITLLIAFGGAFGHALAAGADLLSLAPWQTAVLIAVEAIGGFVGLKKLFRPSD